MDTDLESHIPQEAAKYNGMIAVRELFMTEELTHTWALCNVTRPRRVAS